MKKISSISLIFPVYKDRYTVIKVIDKSIKILKRLKKNYEIIIVDDCCPEQSGKVALAKAKKNKKIKVIFHKKNLGYGAAIKAGFKKSKYEHIYAVDGDGEFGISNNDLPRIIKKFEQNDLIITYRFKKRYNTTRIFISWVYNFILRILFNNSFRDVSSGARLVSKKVLKKIKLTTNSPFIGAELAIKAKFMGFKIGEVGIHSYPNKFRPGSSVVLKNILHTIKDILKLYYIIKFTKKN